MVELDKSHLREDLYVEIWVNLLINENTKLRIRQLSRINIGIKQEVESSKVWALLFKHKAFEKPAGQVSLTFTPEHNLFYFTAIIYTFNSFSTYF